MAANEFIKKFSNEIYATKNDVVKEMKTPLVDGIWTQVLDYRREFYETIPLTNYDSNKFSICLTPTISKHLNNFERHLTTILNKYSHLQRNYASEYFKTKAYKRILRIIANKYKLDTQDTVLDGIINGTIKSNLPASQLILERYFSCLQDIEENFLQDIDENTLGNFYSKLMGTEELTSYYRETELNKYNGYSIGRTKLGVAPNKIESSINQLINFINYDNQSLIVKAVCTFYYIYYVKPFDNYSEEIALLMLKRVLAYNDVNSIAAMLCFEVLFDNKEELENKLGDCQRYYDITYLVNYVLNKVEPLVNKIDDEIVESQNMTIKNELYQADPVEKEPVKEPLFQTGTITMDIPIIEKVPLTNDELKEPLSEPAQETTSFEPLNREEVHEETIANEPENSFVEPQKEETKSILDESEKENDSSKIDFEENHNEEEIKAYNELSSKPVQPSVESSTNETFASNLAISNVPTGLSEEEASRLEIHLMEMNPNLSHGQAYFYARHCTIGMYYTVDQYKKCVGCAYETARSSMNNLVVLGYYKKQLLKKKFVYIPVKRN